MSGLFMGLELGKRAIMAQQTALDITGHNIANANTEGYSRQVATMETTQPYYTPVLTSSTRIGQLGTGVQISSINRIREAFLDSQIRNETKEAGYWESMQETISKIEVIVNEPSDYSIREVLDQFWQSWQDLVSNPESESVRTVVAETGTTLADTFEHVHRQLEELKQDLNLVVDTKVQEINSIAEQIKDLNQQILSIKVSGQEPNDLLDRRDLLLDQLSELVDIKVSEDQNYMVTVQVGGRNLVQGVNCSQMDTETDPDGMHMIVWDDTRVKTRIEGGELRGILDARGRTSLADDASSDYRGLVPEMITKLNELVKTIILETNSLHRAGFSLNNQTGTADNSNFFLEPADPATFEDWASFMQVNPDILSDPNNIAAASSRTWGDPLTGGDPVPPAAAEPINFGDGNNALSIAQLKQALVMGGTMTMDDYWRSLTSTVGVQGQQAERMVENQEDLVSELKNKRESVSGVSLDEEMSNMIKYQHAYNAAARYITAMDEALELVVNRLGLVGR